jgi:hypothetical protein
MLAARRDARASRTGGRGIVAGARANGMVVTYACMPADPRGHENVTRAAIARKLAGLLGFDFAGEYDPAAHYEAPLYFVPSDTLIGRARAAALGIRGTGDLFGAVAPHDFVATKSITHPLVDSAAVAPDGWSADCAKAMRACVLEGYSAFERDDARRAALRLLARGPARIKRAAGIGGTGQFVVRDSGEIADVLAQLDEQEVARFGVVIEENLADVRTHSVGRVDVAGMVVTYCGTQCLARSNHGADVYGGSDLLVARGDFDALLALPISASARMAVDHARRYDAAAHAHFPDLLASRRNYDVAEGLDTHGGRRVGVLEQSWRIGGASGAEVEALAVLQADPGRTAVRASTVELYGDGVAPPPGATVYYQDTDARVGPLTKYTVVEHADA